MTNLIVVTLILVAAAFCAFNNFYVVVALLLLIIQIKFCWIYRNISVLLLFGIFGLVIPLEVIFTLVLDFDFYFLLDQSYLGLLLLLQMMVVIPSVAGKSQVRAVALPPLVKGNALFWLGWAIALLVVVFGFGGVVVVGSEGGYQSYRDNIKQGSGIIEYLLLIFVVLSSFRRNFLMTSFFVFLVLIYAVKCALLGFRVQSVMAIILLIAIFLPSMRPRVTIFLAVVGGGFALLLGVLKHGLQFEIASLIINGNYLQTPHGGAAASSTVILGLLDLNLWESATSLLAFILPRGIIGDIVPWAYPGSYVQMSESTPGGVLVGVYGYYLAGFFGVVLISILLKFMIDGLCKNNARTPMEVVWGFCAVSFFIFFPRWFLYDFGNYGPRMILTFLVMLLLAYIASKSAATLSRLDPRKNESAPCK